MKKSKDKSNLEKSIAEGLKLPDIHTHLTFRY